MPAAAEEGVKGRVIPTPTPTMDVEWPPMALFGSGRLMDFHGGPLMNGGSAVFDLGGDTRLSAFYGFAGGTGTEPGRFEQEENAFQMKEESAFQVKMETRLPVLDLAIRYSGGRTDAADTPFGMRPEEALIPVRWRLLSAGAARRFGNLGFHAEGGHAWLETEDSEIEAMALPEDHSRFIVGVDYTFDNSLYLVLEYFQAGEIPPTSAGGSGEVPLFLNREAAVMGSDNLHVGARYSITDMATIELHNIINANDPTIMINPWLVWSAGRDISLRLSAQIPMDLEAEDLLIEGAAPVAFGSIQLNF